MWVREGKGQRAQVGAEVWRSYWLLSKVKKIRERKRRREDMSVLVKRGRESFSGSHPTPGALRQLPNQTCQLPFEGQSVKVESQYNAVCTLYVAGINDPIQTL